jgi:CubicO group peptidase (beta-lactamase class C family)
MHRRALCVALSVAAVASDAQTAHVSRVEAMHGPTGQALNSRMLSMADSGWSGAVIVEQADTVLLAAGYGLANRERQLPFTTSTIAQVGSLTKQFTATAVADLVHRGELRYTDSLGSLFADLPPAVRGITINMLLSHTSGLKTDCGQDFDPVSRDDLLRRCLAMPLMNSPGKTFLYSNLGYSVLAAIVEKVSGVSIEAYLRAQFFAPLHLDEIGYALPGVSADRLALGYKDGAVQMNVRDQLAMLDDRYWNLRGNGGMQASVDDMHRWYRALRSSTVVHDDERHALFSPHAQREPGVFYGYGWFLRVDSGGRTSQISHSGSDGTFESLWYWRPLEHVFIYTVSNFGESDLSKGTVAALRKVLAAPR